MIKKWIKIIKTMQDIKTESKFIELIGRNSEAFDDEQWQRFVDRYRKVFDDMTKIRHWNFADNLDPKTIDRINNPIVVLKQ